MGDGAKITEFLSYSGDTIERREIDNSVYYHRIKRARPDPEPVTPPEKERPGLGIFCTVARTEFVQKYVTEEGAATYTLNDILTFINYVARHAYDLGKGGSNQ